MEKKESPDRSTTQLPVNLTIKGLMRFTGCAVWLGCPANVRAA
jgi:hypothetical protein